MTALQGTAGHGVGDRLTDRAVPHEGVRRDAQHFALCLVRVGHKPALEPGELAIAVRHCATQPPVQDSAVASRCPLAVSKAPFGRQRLQTFLCQIVHVIKYRNICNVSTA